MKKKHLFDKIISVLDLETEPITAKTLIEIIDNQSVLIEYHCGVISYSTSSIRIKTKNGCILVCGSGLVVSKISCDLLRIHGLIKNVELQGRKNNGIKL